MRKDFFKKLCFLGIFLFIPLAMLGQGISVSGTIKDGAFDSEFPGAAVAVKGTTIGAIADLDGRYSLVVPSKESVLVFSFMGYKTLEVTVGDRTVIDVTLFEDSELVEEAVVIAYGTQNKGLVTSAISSVNTKDLVKSPAASVSNMLAGSMPGVSSVQTTGQPGKDDAAIYVRGSGSLTSSLSSPLILVDGVEREFSQIDPNEIESISVLKDASSTAVFGVRGANGVVLVTTRRGSAGAPKINVSSSMGLQQPIALVRQVGSYEYAKFWNMREDMDAIHGGYYGKFTPEQIEAYRTGSDPMLYPNVDWMKEVFNDFFIQNKNNLNISGGSENVKYFVSMGYLYQNGIMKQMPTLDYDNNYRYNRYNYRANIDAKLTPSTTMKLGVGGYVGKTQQPNMQASYAGGSDGWILTLLWATPWAGPGIVDGVRTLIPSSTQFIPVPERRRDGWFSTADVGGYSQQYRTNLNIDVDITQNLEAITPGLNLSVKGAYDSVFSLTKNRTGGLRRYQEVYYRGHFSGELDNAADFSLPETDPDFDKTYVFATVNNSVDTPLTYSESNGRGQSWYLEGRLNYERTFGNHRVSGLFLDNQSRNYSPGTYSYIPRGYIGYVGRATYSYRGKYMADVNIGYNGSENFAPGKTRYGLFPAFSAGWTVSEEKFMQDQNIFNYLKLRASWGRVGNDTGGSRFMYASTVWSGSGSYSFGAETPSAQPGMAMGTQSNPAVTWETADKQNYGIEAKFLTSRLSLTADYFREHRTGILITPNSFPGITSISWPSMNLGIVNNHGYEASLGWNDMIGDLTYYANANVSFARNKIVYMDEVANTYDYMNFTGGSTGRRELLNGYGIGGNLYQFERLYQEDDFTLNADGTYTLNPDLPQPAAGVLPGDAMYADLNGDGIVDSDDRLVTGFGTNPEYTFGLNAGLNWRGFNFSMQWVGATNVNRFFYEYFRYPFTNSGSRGLLSYFYDDCWTFDNRENAIYPRPTSNPERVNWNYGNPSTIWLKDSSYLRLKNLTLGYTMSGAALKKVGIGSLQVTLSGYNLITFSALKYIDPESVPNNSGAYPLVKLYNLGVNINF